MLQQIMTNISVFCSKKSTYFDLLVTLHHPLKQTRKAYHAESNGWAATCSIRIFCERGSAVCSMLRIDSKRRNGEISLALLEICHYLMVNLCVFGGQVDRQNHCTVHMYFRSTWFHKTKHISWLKMWASRAELQEAKEGSTTPSSRLWLPNCPQKFYILKQSYKPYNIFVQKSFIAFNINIRPPKILYL